VDHDQSMELRQLVYFEAVARLGGFTRAAEELRIAQPAISAQIQRLEKDLGTTLLTRTTRRVTLTESGQLLLGRARAVLDELAGARADVAELTSVERGRLRLGATPMLGPLDLPTLLAGFNRRYPAVTVSVTTALVSDLLALIDDDRLDAVLGPVHDDLPQRFVGRPLARERLVLITPPAGRRSMLGTALADVRDQPFVCLPPGSGLRALLTAAASAAGFEPHVQFELGDPGAVRAAVAAGLGVAVVAESTARADGPTVSVHSLSGAPAHPPIGLIRHRDRAVPPVLRAWLQQVGRSHPSDGRSSRKSRDADN
jgi:LysR family transcriptional activator of glutamate synthase operon